MLTRSRIGTRISPATTSELFDTDLGINKDYGPAGPRRTPTTPAHDCPGAAHRSRPGRGYRRQLAVVARFASGWPAVHALWQRRDSAFDALADDATFAAELAECLLSFHPADRADVLHHHLQQHQRAKRFQEGCWRRRTQATGETTSMIDLMGGLAEISHMALQSGIVRLHRVAVAQRVRPPQSGSRPSTTSSRRTASTRIWSLTSPAPGGRKSPERIRDLIEGMVRAETPPADPQAGLTAQRRRFETQLRCTATSSASKSVAQDQVQPVRSTGMSIGCAAISSHVSRCANSRRSAMRSCGRMSWRRAGDWRRTAGWRANRTYSCCPSTSLPISSRAGSTGGDVAAAVAFRRAMYEGYRDISPPHELGGGIADHSTSADVARWRSI